MTGVYMNNNKDDKEKEPIKIDIENLQDLSEEEIIKLINELSEKDPNYNKNVSFFVKCKRFIISYLKNLIIDFILIFTINVLMNVVDTRFVYFLVFFVIANFLDFVFNRYLTMKYPLVMMISFGLANFIITFLSFIISGIICLQLFEIVFASVITYVIAIILFISIKKFVVAYFLKFRKKVNKNVSNK